MMYRYSRTAVSRTSLLVNKMDRLTMARSFSGACEPAQRFRNVLEAYRQQNYSDELPSRFRKEVLKTVYNSEDKIKVERLNDILNNIGHSEARLSEADFNTLLGEAGAKEDRSISVQQMMQLM